ncbi:MAG: tetratricopeptide repeat protein [Candidatus Omnitrophota bacterium]
MFSKKYTISLSIALIMILGFSVYLNSLNNEFLYDDDHLIRDNSYIRSYSNIKDIFTHDVGGGIGVAAGGEYYFYRPLQIYTYLLDYSLWKLDVRGYHLTNILLHLLVGICVYWLVNILYSDKLLSLLTGVFYIIHPVHTEAVAYISGRSDPLALLFILLCIIYYIKSLDSQRLLIYLAMCLSYILALLSRESAMILPILLLLYHYAFNKKMRLKSFILVVVISLGYIVARTTVLSSTLRDLPHDTSLIERIPLFFASMFEYIRILVVPLDLHMGYGRGEFVFYDPKVIIGIIVILALLTSIFMTRKRNRLVFFSISWFLISLLPVSGLYPINAFMAEHWLYLPSIGFFVILARGVTLLYRKRELRVFSIAIIMSIISLCSFLTIRQNTYWRDPISFYERTIKFAPEDLTVLTNLANEYTKIDKNKEAIPLLKKAIEVNPYYAEPYNNLGNAYIALGKDREAIPVLNKAIEIDPDYLTPYNNIGIAYFNIGERQKAIDMIKKAIDIDPTYKEGHYNLSLAYLKEEEYDLAKRHCDISIRLGHKPAIFLLKAIEESVDLKKEDEKI